MGKAQIGEPKPLYIFVAMWCHRLPFPSQWLVQSETSMEKKKWTTSFQKQVSIQIILCIEIYL